MTRTKRVVSVLAASALVAATAAGAQVAGLSGTLIVTNKSASTATIIDVASGRTLAQLPTGAGPHEVVISRDGRHAVVTDYGGATRRTLTVIDVPALKIARTIDLGPYTAPHGIAFLPGDTIVAVTSEATRNVVLADIVRGDFVAAIGTQGNGSHMVGVTGDGSKAYTGNMGSSTVSELDLRTRAFTRTWEVPPQPEAINVTADGKEVWVGSNSTGKVSVIDVATGAVTTAAEGVAWPYRVAYTPDMVTVIIPDMRNEEVRFLERASRRELGRIALPGAGPQGIVITPDGRYAFLSLSRQAKVVVIDIRARAIVREVLAGETPDGVAYSTRVIAR